MQADLPATAVPVLDEASRRSVFTALVDDVNQPSNPAGLPEPVAPAKERVASSPPIHVVFDE